LSALALAFQRPDQDQNILGWLIIFFMVVWPLIRGAVEAANERRRKFVEEQRRRDAGPSAPQRPRAGGPPDRPADPFEDLRRALMGSATVEAEEVDEPRPARRPEAATPPRQKPPGAPKTPARTAGAGPGRGKPARGPEAPARPRAGAPAPPPRAPERARPDTLAGDPFDERMLERPLVADPELARVPSEGGRPSEAPQRRITRAPETPYETSQGGPRSTAEVVAEATPVALRQPAPAAASRGEAVALARIARRVRSPWGRAVLYEELLGPPVSLREPRI